jgi:hypothetical protein
VSFAAADCSRDEPQRESSPGLTHPIQQKLITYATPFRRHGEGPVSTGDDFPAGLEYDLVIGDALEEIFEFGGEAGALFAALLGDGEVAEDVGAGVADEAGEIHQHVVGGVVDGPVITRGQETLVLW